MHIKIIRGAMAELLNSLFLFSLFFPLSILSSKRLCFYWSFHAPYAVINTVLQSFL